MAIFRRDPHNWGKKSPFSTNIWLWDRRLVEIEFRQQFSTVESVYNTKRRLLFTAADAEMQRISESSQESCSVKL